MPTVHERIGHPLATTPFSSVEFLRTFKRMAVRAVAAVKLETLSLARGRNGADRDL